MWMLDFGVFSIQGRGSSEWVCFRDCPGPQPELLCGPPGTCKPLFIYANSMVHVCKLNASAPAIFPEEPLHVFAAGPNKTTSCQACHRQSNILRRPSTISSEHLQLGCASWRRPAERPASCFPSMVQNHSVTNGTRSDLASCGQVAPRRTSFLESPECVGGSGIGPIVRQPGIFQRPVPSQQQPRTLGQQLRRFSKLSPAKQQPAHLHLWHLTWSIRSNAEGTSVVLWSACGWPCHRRTAQRPSPPTAWLLPKVATGKRWQILSSLWLWHSSRSGTARRYPCPALQRQGAGGVCLKIVWQSTVLKRNVAKQSMSMLVSVT